MPPGSSTPTAATGPPRGRRPRQAPHPTGGIRGHRSLRRSARRRTPTMRAARTRYRPPAPARRAATGSRQVGGCPPAQRPRSGGLVARLPGLRSLRRSRRTARPVGRDADRSPVAAPGPERGSEPSVCSRVTSPGQWHVVPSVFVDLVHQLRGHQLAHEDRLRLGRGLAVAAHLRRCSGWLKLALVAYGWLISTTTRHEPGCRSIPTSERHCATVRPDSTGALGSSMLSE